MKFIDFKAHKNKRNGQLILNPLKRQMEKAKLDIPDKSRVRVEVGDLKIFKRKKDDD